MRLPEPARPVAIAPGIRRRMSGVLILILGCMLSGCTGVFLQPDRVAHFPGRSVETPVTDVWITAPDGTALHALYLPARGRARATVLYLHGNAENLSSHIHLARWLPGRGYNLLALDYRGYGRSEGRAAVAGVHQDVQAALSWLVERDGAPLVLYGHSLGGSVAIHAAATSPHRTRIAAVIADSAFASYRDIAREKLGQLWLTWPLQWPLSWLISDRYAALPVVGQLSPIPLLLIHGEHDPVVPVHHAESLFAAAGEPRALGRIPQGGHIDSVRRAAVRDRMHAYLDAITARSPAVTHPDGVVQ